jgi:tRNA/tmRNA/rRNA uracil-C5-methylase (TrmA/RlmC/RlmD family)
MRKSSRERAEVGKIAAAAGCSHRPPCPGCPRFAVAGIASAARERLGALARANGFGAVTVVDGAEFGFRCRGRLAIRGHVGAPKIGLFESGTHRVVHIPNCRVHHPLINRVAAVVRRALADTRVTSYSEGAHLGIARYLQVVVERSSQSAQVVLVVNADDAQAVAACCDLIIERLGDSLHSLWLNFNRERGNVILGEAFERRLGPECVVERFGGHAVHYPPGAFGQNNLEVSERLIAHVRALIPPGADVAEFYAGVGAIGLSILNRVTSLRCNEVSPASLRGLELGIAALDATDRAKLRVLAGPAATAQSAADGASVIVVDPPRKGLDPELAAHIARFPPERFIYVSCSLDSLLADTELLLGSGRLRLTALHAFNLMPFTEHVETVACFERI